MTDPRRPLDPAALQSAVGPRWTVRHVALTGSTNADLARSDTPDHTVLVAEQQSAGRGRLGRRWVAPAGAGLLFSAAVRVDGIPVARRAWLGALLGLAVVRGIGVAAGLDAALKWPNDVLIDDRKVAGLLAEAVGELVVVGAGINVTTAASELPRPDACSLASAGAADPDRAVLLGAVLLAFDELVGTWTSAGGEVLGTELASEYRAACRTLGRRVRLDLPDGGELVGTAVDVAADGALVVDTGDGTTSSYAAGDVVHLRTRGQVDPSEARLPSDPA